MASGFYPSNLSRAQRHLVMTLIRRGYRAHAPYRDRISAIETGIVEAGLGNPIGGGGTSSGWRQETTGSYGGLDRRNVRQSADRFYRELRGVHGGTTGSRAQAVQRSAYPGRYEQHKGEAIAIYHALAGRALRQFTGKGGGSSGGGGGGGSLSAKLRTQNVAGQRSFPTPGMVDPSLLQQPTPQPRITAPLAEPATSARRYLHLPQGYQPPQSAGSAAPTSGDTLSASLSAVAGLGGGNVPHTPVTQRSTLSGSLRGSGKSSGSKGGGIRHPSSYRGVAHFEGHVVAHWIKPWLVYARRHGWKGTVSSGYRSFAEQTRIYNSGVRPAARPGTSNHEGRDFPRGAVDVTDAAGLSRILRRAHSPLIWAGSKDPVHFSHPHGGSY